MAMEFVLWIIVAAVVGLAAVVGYFLLRTRRIARRAERLVPPPGRFVEIDGNRVHYVEKGEGRPVLFVHGLGGTQFHFTWPLFDRLESEYRLIALDRPGSGYSTRAAGGPEDVFQQARFIARFIDTMGLEKPLVVGHSLGGGIALALALEHPDKVSGLALLSPLTHHNGETPPEFAALDIRSPLLRRIVAHTVSAPMAIRYAEQTLDFVFGPQKPPRDYAIAGGAMAALRPQHFYGSATDFVAIGDGMTSIEARYGELALPVGILFGSADRVLDCEKHGLSMAGRIKGLDLEILQGVGHMPQYAQPERVVDFIRRTAERAFTLDRERSTG